MKKTIFTLIAATALILTSCQDPMFYHIRQEVQLEKATVLGDIYSIVRYSQPGKQEELYLSNGKIYRKNANDSSYGKWTEFSTPEIEYQREYEDDRAVTHIQKVAADGTYLYALAALYGRNDEEGEMRIKKFELFYTNNGTWNKVNVALPIDQDMTEGKITNETHLFCTNTVTKTERKAFIRTKNGCFELNGGTVGSPIAGAASAKSVYYKGGALTYNNGNAAFSHGNKYAYTNVDEIVYNNDDGRGEQKIKTGMGILTSVCMTQDSILVTSMLFGFKRFLISNQEVVDFSNASSTISSIYESHVILAVNPDANTLADACYASIQVKGNGANSAQFTHQGLWAYYPSRAKWNIE